MLEDKIVEVEDVEETTEVQEENNGGGLTQNCKAALGAFIASVVGLGLSAIFIGLIGGILGISFLKKIKGEPEKQPFKVFAKIAKPVSIVTIILSIAMFVFWFLYILLVVILGVVALSGGLESIAVLF